MTQRTSLFLMANLGSEVSKIISAKEKNDGEMLDLARAKATLILSELKQLPDTKNNTEIDILAKVIADLTKKVSAFHISSKNLKAYFLPFTLRLMQA